MEQKSYWKKESTPFFLIFLNGFVWGMGYSIGWYDASVSFPRAMSQAAALARIFGECREG